MNTFKPKYQFCCILLVYVHDGIKLFLYDFTIKQNGNSKHEKKKSLKIQRYYTRRCFYHRAKLIADITLSPIR